MDALVPAFVAALFAQLGDRSAWLAAILADRCGRPWKVAIAALIAHAAGNSLAATGGALIAPVMTPNARQLLLALALVFAGAGALWRLRAPDRLEGWRLGMGATAFLGIFILALGDTTQFLTLAFAARGPSPWLAATGATLAAFLVSLAAALMGEQDWRKLPLRWVRIAFGLISLLAGAILAAGALRLI